MNVEGLRLVNEGTSSECQVDDLFLADFPDSLEDLFSFLRNLGNFLDGTVLSDQLVSDFGSP